LRSARGETDAYAALRVCLPFLAGLFDFGSWSLEGTQETLRIELAGFARTPPSLHDWLSGVIEHAARSGGRPYRVTVARANVETGEGSIGFVATLSV
jgi:hypothetical protein